MKQSNRRRSFRLFAATFALLSAAGHAQATSQSFRDLHVEVIGKGQPVLMIPGLNSEGAGTWRETCEALQQDKVQCHIVTLPGFAGQPAIKSERFTDDMRDRLLAYLGEHKLKRPVVMGHSLGGFLALQMAIKQPKAIEKLVIVDSLPFLTALYDPTATAESAKPMAEGFRLRMSKSDHASPAYRAQMAGMTNQPARVDTIVGWGKVSDPETTSKAMYELMTTDLRSALDQIKVPTLVLGAFYGPNGGDTFKAQYAKLDGVQIETSATGKHFVMWDDPNWLQTQVRGFLKTGDGT